MHTHLQSMLLKEIYGLIPDGSQLWVSTHSLGMLRMAQALEDANPGTVVFLDFDGHDFDSQVTIEPTVINKTVLRRFMQLALDDFSSFIAPKEIVFCEGNPRGHANPNFDARVYSKIFGELHPDVAFVSAGSCTEVENKKNIVIEAVSSILQDSSIRKLVDRDDLSDEEVEHLAMQGIKALGRRNIECYLFADEIITKLCVKKGHPELANDCIGVKVAEIKSSIARGHAVDDVKSASGPIMVNLKKKLSLNRCGNTLDSFFLDTIVPLITPDTEVYQQLERDIWGLKSEES